LAPQAVETDPRAALALVRSAGGLPLALQLMGSYLRMEAASGQARRVRQAVAVLQDTKKRMNLELIQGSLERHTALSPGTTLSLRAILDVSTKRMKQQKAAGNDAYQALKILSLFAPKPSSFSEEAALAVCGVPNSALDVLVDFGLLEVRSTGRYTIHQVVHDYARIKWCEEAPQAAQHTTQRRLVEYYSALLRVHARDYPRLEGENQNILAALSFALNLGMPRVFLEAVLAFAPCMEMQGQYTKSKDLLESAADVAVSLGDSRALASTRLHLGRLAELRGEYEQAAHLYDEGLNTTAQTPQDAARIALLARRADIAVCCDDSRQAEHLVRQGLQLADQLGDQRETGFLLRVQAHIAGNQGDLQLGDTLYPAAIELALAAEDIETALVCLQHLGVIAFKRGQYDAAEKYFTEGLHRAHQFGHVRRIAALQNALGCVKAEYATMKRHATSRKQRDTWLQEAEHLYRACLSLATDFELPYWQNNALQNLGALERARHHYTQAGWYLEQALQIAHKLRDRWLISETECERGKVYLETGLIDKAITVYEKALEVANDGGDMEVELAGLAYFGLGRAFAANGQFRQAFHYGTMSLRHLSDLGFVARAREVNDWLEALPLADY
jgi:tetratricopeptide (TPR) repeat protein